MFNDITALRAISIAAYVSSTIMTCVAVLDDAWPQASFWVLTLILNVLIDRNSESTTIHLVITSDEPATITGYTVPKGHE
jgi:hypothetical protein